MLVKKFRLNLRTDFERVVSGRKIEDDLVKIFFIQTSQKPSLARRFIQEDDRLARVGIAPSGKIFKKAVERNRVKRLVAQAFQTLYPQLKKGLRVVVIPKGGVLGLKSGQLTLRIEQLLKKYQLINNETVNYNVD